MPVLSQAVLLLLNQTFGLWRNTSTRCRARQEHRHKVHHQDRDPPQLYG